jgi:hypothetical protein
MAWAPFFRRSVTGKPLIMFRSPRRENPDDLLGSRLNSLLQTLELGKAFARERERSAS